jgi:hypothetical protein
MPFLSALEQESPVISKFLGSCLLWMNLGLHGRASDAQAQVFANSYDPSATFDGPHTKCRHPDGTPDPSGRLASHRARKEGRRLLREGDEDGAPLPP